MEQRIVRQDIKNCQAIHYHPDFFLFESYRFQSCSKQGGSLFTYPDIRTSIHRIASLPNNRLLVDDARGVFHLLDLETGSILKSQKMTRKRICKSRFAISPDGTIAYSMWFWGKEWFLAKIDLRDLSYDIYQYSAGMYGVSDIVYKGPNEVHVLETQNISVDGRTLSQYQIVSAVICGENCKTNTIYRWEGSGSAKFFDGEFVWESRYRIRNVKTSESFRLLEQSDIIFSDRYTHLSHIYYPEQKFLQLIDSKQNIFIDCEKRKVIARYSNDPQKLIYQGICVGNEFWIGKANGIYAMPFPAIEEI